MNDGEEGAKPVRVYAVVVTWKDADSTLVTIRSLKASRVPIEKIHCIALQLTEDQRAALRDALKVDELLDYPTNLGFAAAANIGINLAESAGATHVVLLNNDATIDPRCVGLCLEEMLSDSRIAVVEPTVAYANRPDRLWFAGARMSKWLALAWNQGALAKASNPPASHDCDYMPSACVLISSTAWGQIGPFMDEYFMYFEDVEWGQRARAAGWRLRYLGKVLSTHVMGGSSVTAGTRFLAENTAYYLARNPVLFAHATSGPLLRATRLFGTLVLWSTYNATRIRPKSWSSVGRAYLEGLVDGLAGRSGPRGARA